MPQWRGSGLAARTLLRNRALQDRMRVFHAAMEGQRVGCPDTATQFGSSPVTSRPQWRGSGLAARTLWSRVASGKFSSCRNGGAAGWLPGHESSLSRTRPCEGSEGRNGGAAGWLPGRWVLGRQSAHSLTGDEAAMEGQRVGCPDEPDGPRCVLLGLYPLAAMEGQRVGCPDKWTQIFGGPSACGQAAMEGQRVGCPDFDRPATTTPSCATSIAAMEGQRVGCPDRSLQKLVLTWGFLRVCERSMLSGAR